MALIRIITYDVKTDTLTETEEDKILPDIPVKENKGINLDKLKSILKSKNIIHDDSEVE